MQFKKKQSIVFIVSKKIDRDDLIEYLRQNNIETTIGTYCLSNTTYYREKYNDIQPVKLLEENTILTKNEIATAIYYPIPLHLQKVFEYLPIAEKVAENILALPIGPTLTKEQQEYIITKVKEFFKEI